MSLREIAMRKQEPAADADECPSCLWFDDLERQYTEHPTIQRKVAKWRALHLEHDECLAARDDG
ncbi:hypothetical protein ACFVSN_14435 [Kitasatospora sp. NPDC057904]|uniref:hypothetical protein n=1 Tax=Kitasatospora sp. NPDC057904 TaxID=3346275 RepID=UPI0036D8B1A7